MADQVYPVNHNGDQPIGEASWEEAQGATSRLMSREGVVQLTQDLRSFSETLTSLKSVFCEEKDLLEPSLRVVAHERLGELLKVLKNIVNKYTELNSTGILSAAENLINHIKHFNYENVEEVASPEIFSAINNLALAFSSSVSECLIGDINISPRQSMVSSQSYESLPLQPHHPSHHRQVSLPFETAQEGNNVNATVVDYPLSTSETVADVLDNVTENLDICFERAKAWSKYANDLITYVKKKAHIEMEYSKQLTKLSQATRAILSEQSFLPFQSLYCTSLDNDKEYASNLVTTYQNVILANKFIEPLQAKRAEHDRQHKALRDAWRKNKRRLEEAEVNLKKAKQQYQTRNQEYQKAKDASIRADQQQHSTTAGGDPQHVRQGSNPGSVGISLGASGSSTALSVLPTAKMEKKKRQEDDSYLKAVQAEHYYRACVNEANSRRKELERKEVQQLRTLRDLMTQCDQTTKTVTMSFFQLHCDLTSPLRVQYQALLDESKNYEPGFQYAEYLKHVTPQQTGGRLDYQFEPYPIEGTAYMDHHTGMKADMDETSPLGGALGHGERFSALRTAGHKGGFSDTESSSSRSIDDISPSASPGEHPNRKTVYKRRPSTGGSLSSEDILDDGPYDSAEPVRLVPPPTFEHNVVQSSPESSPAPVRPQLPRVLKAVTNALKGMKKNAKPTIFGVDFSVAAQDSPDGVPLLIKKCIAEIDNRALTVKGIYRVNGVKNRVEKLCSMLDSPNCLKVDLSEQLPHDVSGVLKYFLRQLPEPLMQSRFYNEFLDAAKNYHDIIKKSNTAEAPPVADQSDADEERVQSLPDQVLEDRTTSLNLALDRMRATVDKLPEGNRNTLQYIVAHLSRVTEHHNSNKMNASNLAIIFGPTLLRPVHQIGNELQTLIELPSQSQAIEMLITHRNKIFDTYSNQARAEEIKISDRLKQMNVGENPTQSDSHVPGNQPPTIRSSQPHQPGPPGDAPTTTDQIHLVLDDHSQSTTTSTVTGDTISNPETEGAASQRNSLSADSSTGQSNGVMIDDGRAIISHSTGVRKCSSSRDLTAALPEEEHVTHDDISIKPTARLYLSPTPVQRDRPTSLPPPGAEIRAAACASPGSAESGSKSPSPISVDPPCSPIRKGDEQENTGSMNMPVAPARLKSKQRRGEKKTYVHDFPIHPPGETGSESKLSPHRPRSRRITDHIPPADMSRPIMDDKRDPNQRTRRISMPVAPRVEPTTVTKFKRHSNITALMHPSAYRPSDESTGSGRRLPQLPSETSKITSPTCSRHIAMPGRTPPFNKSQQWSFVKADIVGDGTSQEDRGVNISTGPIQRRILNEEEEDEEVSFC